MACDDPPKYRIQPVVTERLSGRALPESPDLDFCSHHYQELVLELKPLSIKGGGNVQPFRGVQKL